MFLVLLRFAFKMILHRSIWIEESDWFRVRKRNPTVESFWNLWKHFRYFANIITAPKMDRSHNQETHFGLVQSTGIRYFRVSELASEISVNDFDVIDVEDFMAFTYLKNKKKTWQYLYPFQLEIRFRNYFYWFCRKRSIAPNPFYY